jgi:hypothetical protein
MKYHEEFPKVSSVSVCYGVELIENFFSKKDCERSHQDTAKMEIQCCIKWDNDIMDDYVWALLRDN